MLYGLPNGFWTHSVYHNKHRLGLLDLERIQQSKKGVDTLKDEILELCDDADFDMEHEIDEAVAKNGGQWTVEAVCYYLYGSFANYDEPQKAMSYCDVTSPRYRGGDWWNQWKHEHWVGSEGMRERALKDPYIRSYLERFNLLSEDDGAG